MFKVNTFEFASYANEVFVRSLPGCVTTFETEVYEAKIQRRRSGGSVPGKFEPAGRAIKEYINGVCINI